MLYLHQVYRKLFQLSQIAVEERIYIGLEETDNLSGSVEVIWDGFSDEEDCNAIFQVLEEIYHLDTYYSAEFLDSPNHTGIILHLTIFKTKDILKASNNKIYTRRNAQNLPVEKEDAVERLKRDKGMVSFENETLSDIEMEEITNSNIVLEFLIESLDAVEPEMWLKKQRVISNGKPTVAGVLLYSDLPQSILPKRSAIKILRYQTKGEGERAALVFDPITIEGPIYNLIYDAVEKCKSVIEGIEKLGDKGLETIIYPEEALHEILTNAVLHRDYSIVTDVQVRIYDN